MYGDEKIIAQDMITGSRKNVSFATFANEWLQESSSKNIKTNQSTSYLKDWHVYMMKGFMQNGSAPIPSILSDDWINSFLSGFGVVPSTIDFSKATNDLLKDLPNAEKFSSIAKTFYEESVERGHGDSLISELMIQYKSTGLNYHSHIYPNLNNT